MNFKVAQFVAEYASKRDAEECRKANVQHEFNVSKCSISKKYVNLAGKINTLNRMNEHSNGCNLFALFGGGEKIEEMPK